MGFHRRASGTPAGRPARRRDERERNLRGRPHRARGAVGSVAAIYTRTRAHMYTIYMRTRTHVHDPYARAHACTRSIRARTHVHTRTHRHAHKRMRTHMRAHKHDLSEAGVSAPGLDRLPLHSAGRGTHRGPPGYRKMLWVLWVLKGYSGVPLRSAGRGARRGPPGRGDGALVPSRQGRRRVRLRQGPITRRPSRAARLQRFVARL